MTLILFPIPRNPRILCTRAIVEEYIPLSVNTPHLIEPASPSSTEEPTCARRYTHCLKIIIIIYSQ